MKKSILYTGGGDKGTTSLASGQRVSKTDPRLEAYGTVDELNSHIGLLISMAADMEPDVKRQLIEVQHRLFDIGSSLATMTASGEIVPEGVNMEKVAALERNIDIIDGSVPPLKNFILPGGSMASSQAHVARTVCRRAERRIAELNEIAEVSPNILIYINRLSDYLFALSRYLNVASGHEETAWQPIGRKD